MTANQYKAQFEASPIGILVVKDHRIVSGNPAACTLLGTSSEILHGQPFPELFHPEDRKRVTERLGGPQGDAGPEESPYRIIRLDGSEMLGKMRVVLPKSESSEGFLIFIEDVSERHRMEEHLGRVQRMEAIGELAAGIAHDFNHVIGALSNYFRLLQGHVTPTGESEGYVRDIQKLLERGQGLIQQILGFSRRQHSRLQVEDLHEVLAAVIPMLQRTLPKRIRLRFDEQELPSFLMDAGQIQQVVINLCLNAADAMPKGGEITIRTELARGSSSRQSNRTDENDTLFAKIAVKDTGVGMSPDTLNRIFQPFFSTKSSGDGSGLGLSICDRIVRAHGGLIDAQSEPGKGTVFSVFLPLRGEVQSSSASTPGPAEKGEEALLLVDDEERMLVSTAVLLRGLGYRVFTASAGPEAIEMFSKDPESYGVVILDQGMPGMDGAETYQRLREIRPGVKALLLTGLPEKDETKRLAKSGILDVIEKPFQLETLSKKIRKALDSS